MRRQTKGIQILERKNSASSRIMKIDNSALNILSLIFEFRLAAGWQISRFICRKDKSQYIYKKLRYMWEAGLLERFQLFSGSVAGIPLYYVLSKESLKILGLKKGYNKSLLKTHPKLTDLLKLPSLEHETEIVELASLESQNKSEKLDIIFSGETGSKALGFVAEKRIEILTPDYTATYRIAENLYPIYTEFERTRKTHKAMLNKVQRYYDFFPIEKRQSFILRLIFRTPGMEQAFWLNLITNQPGLLKLHIVTTNLTLITNSKDFLGDIYAQDRAVDICKHPLLRVEISRRAKLFDF